MTAVAPAGYEERLRTLEARLAEHARRLERTKDSRCVFTHAYSLMTAQIAEDLPLREDVDREWLTSLAEAFGARYLAALEAAPDELAPAWAEAFAAMRNKRTSVIEDLVFAMTVHIVHDLPLAIGDVSDGGLPAEQHVYDFHAINAVMANSIDAVQATCSHRYSPYIRWLDHLGERYDEILTNYGIRMSRGLAWYNALRLADPRSHEDAAGAIERSPQIVVQQIVRPPILSLRLMLRCFRFVVSYLRTWPTEKTERGMRLGRY